MYNMSWSTELHTNITLQNALEGGVMVAVNACGLSKQSREYYQLFRTGRKLGRVHPVFVGERACYLYLHALCVHQPKPALQLGHSSGTLGSSR